MRFNRHQCIVVILLILQATVLRASHIDEFKKISVNGKFGLANAATDEVVIPAKYDDIGWSDGTVIVIDGVIGFKENETWGLVNIEGKKVVNSQYTLLYPFTKNLLITALRSRFSIFNKYGVSNTKGKIVIPIDLENVTVINQNLIISKRINSIEKAGFMNAAGKLVIPLEFESIQRINSNLLAVENDEGFMAIYTIEGDQKSSFDFESIKPLDENRFLISFYNRKGVVDGLGQMIVAPKYKDIRLDQGQLIGVPFDKWTLLDAENKVINSFFFDKILPLTDSSFAVQTNNNTAIITQGESYLSYFKDLELSDAQYELLTVNDGKYFGILNALGKYLIPLRQDSVWVGQDLVFSKIKRPNNQSWTPYDHTGKQVGFFQYEHFQHETADRLKARRNSKWGLLDNLGGEVSPFLYDSLSALMGSFAKVYYQNSYGVINENGIWVVTPYKDDMTLMEENMLYKQGSENGIMDLEGNTLYRSQNAIEPIGSLFLEKNRDDQYILLNRQGSRDILEAVDTLMYIEPSLYIFKKNNRWEVYNSTTKARILLDKDIQEVKDHEEDLISVRIDGKWGFIDERGQLSIANRYDSVQHFSEGLSAIKLIGKWGFIDKQERLVIQPTYDEVTPFYGQLSIVRKNSRFGLIDLEGKEVLPVKYDKIIREKDHLLFYENGQVGLANRNGVVARDPQYSSIEQINKTQFMVSKNGKFGVISIKGLDIIPLAYDYILTFNGKFLVREKAASSEVVLK